MSVTSTPNQIRYTGGGNLDPKMDSVQDLDELYAAIPRRERREGMTVPVMNPDGDGTPYDYWLVGGTANDNWERKGMEIKGNDVEL